MKTLNISKLAIPFKITYLVYGALFLIILWHTLPIILQWFNATVGMVDGGIWQLLLFTMISFLTLTLLSAWLFQSFLIRMGLPKLQMMVSQFKTLTLCQQFAFYWASFALLLLASVVSLAAVF